ncbi:MAG: uncharacterized protein JWQ62_3023 [Lacunisphaera sp.]|nr:uncharacterized protein [Lacunisphaera sp.]
MKSRLLPFLACLGASLAAAPTDPGATPDFGPNVLIFDPAMTDLQPRLDAVFAKQERNQFGPERVAYLFKPGKYQLDVQVGFYMQVLGLGRSPDDVEITGAVRSKARWMRNNNATCNFWRAVENLAVVPTLENNTDIWAVSQATALRRVHVKGNINLWDGGWASGGFLADCKIDGQINSGTQQQWISRNATWGKWVGASWNMVFVGVTNPPAGNWPNPAYTVVEKTPVSREKPYLFIDADGRYFVMVPELRRQPTQGITWGDQPTPGKVLPIDRFYLAHPGTDTAASLNAALSAGKNLLFTPGIYHLDASLNVTRPGAIVLGLGYATLVPDQGTPAMVVADVDGVEIGGLLFEAGPGNSETLLQVGAPHSTTSHAADPIFLHDIFARAGGATVGIARCLVTLNSHNVVGDNFWLWRADHGTGAAWDANRNANGLIVNGDDVTIYGLLVEHNQEYQTLWNGNGGRVYLYQSEIPYDPPSQAAWMNGTARGFASYKVADTVTTHEAWGLGVYCVFRKTPVILDNAIETPNVPGVKLHHMVILRLNPNNGSGIAHVINGRGDPVIETKTSRVDEQ